MTPPPSFRSWRIAWESARGAAANAGAHPLRSALAGLALAAAVATTALVVTALEGLEQAARQTGARAFGTDTFVLARVFPGRYGRRELADKLARNPLLRRSDVRFLERWSEGRVLYAPTAQTAVEVTAGGRDFENAAVSGTTAELEELRDLGLVRGRFLRPDEDRRGAQVAVLGHDVAEELFPGRDPLGAMVRIGGRGFRVVGVQGAQGTSGGQSLDRYVWIPLKAHERIFGAGEGLQVVGRAAAGQRRQAGEDRARATLRARRHLRPGEEDNFDLLTPEASRTFVDNLSRRIGAAGPPISAMALLAAVVVVTNTILVSIAQRTREIGIRRAVGAARGHILMEVLAESLLIALAGGLVGLLGAWAVLGLASGALGLPLPLRLSTAAGSLLAATAAGVVAGAYPARRAAAIEVTTALHRE